MTELQDYFLDIYGKCRLSTDCHCLRGPWLGRACPNWIPTNAKSWQELSEEQAKLYQASTKLFECGANNFED